MVCFGWEAELRGLASRLLVSGLQQDSWQLWGTNLPAIVPQDVDQECDTQVLVEAVFLWSSTSKWERD